MGINNIISQEIWQDRYAKDNETYHENLKRVAKFLASAETTKELQTKYEHEFYKTMDDKLFFPAGRTMSNAGLGGKLTLNNCFVLNSIPDSIEGIFETVKNGAKVHAAGGGVGYDASQLRPNGMSTKGLAIASGPVSFLKVFDAQTSTILQNNRRGANMGCLSIWHPDIVEFIEVKSKDSNVLKHFNLSVMVDDEFMNAKNNGETILLHWPIYNEDGSMIKDKTKWKITKEINAKELWNKITMLAYNNGEPGVLYYDAMNRNNPINYMENIIATNPCRGVLIGSNI